MESREALAGKSLRRAVLISLLLHSAVLLIKVSSPAPTRPALFATIVKPDKSLAKVQPSPHREAPPRRTPRQPTELREKPTTPPILTVPSGAWAARSWSSAERAEMDQFLKELEPPTGQELSQRALAMARQLGRYPQDEREDEATDQPAVNGRTVEPFSLELYFEAFVHKLNRSAAFVKNDPRVPGSRKALVQISLNADGSLKSYRVLRSADQQSEIAYVKKVLDRASPFAAFPPDIRNDRDSLSILMCIYPPHEGQGGGFSRSFGAQDCKD